METCKRCKGRGHGAAWYADKGVCWECQGHGKLSYKNMASKESQFRVCAAIEVGKQTKREIDAYVQGFRMTSKCVNACLENLVRVGFVQKDGTRYVMTELGEKRFRIKAEENKREVESALMLT